MVWIYGWALTVVFAAPGGLALSSRTYPFISAGRFAAFLVSVLLFVALGRRLARQRRRRAPAGLATGFFAAFVGTLGFQAIIRLPQAVASLAATLPGVPRPAVSMMLAQHQTVGALLSGLIAGVLNAVLGAVAVFWGGRSRRLPTPPEAGEERSDATPSKAL